MGLPPSEVESMTLWRFMEIADVWNQAHSDKTPTISDDDMDELAAKLGIDHGDDD
jgi:hypothetical protein